jgi:cysteine synthase
MQARKLAAAASRRRVQTRISTAVTRHRVHSSASSSGSGSERGGVHESTLDAIGNTPIIRLRHMAPPGVTVYVKWEAFNPMLSMKDRLSAGLIEWAHAHGQLDHGKTVVDVISGSSGVGLALACRERDHPLVAVMGNDSAVEWRQLMRFMGAKVVVADCPETTAAAVAEKHGWFLAAHPRPDANEWIHAHKTGPVILEALGPQRLSHFIAPHGTGGMLRGVGRILRARSPATRICVVDQDSRPHVDYEVMNGPHYSWPAKLMDGWTTDFKPTSIDDASIPYVDDIITISGHEALRVARELASSEGIFTGISGGALTAGALRVAREAPKGACVLTVLLDTSHVHLSTPLLDGMPTQMSDEEAELAAAGSTSKRPHR